MLDLKKQLICLIIIVIYCYKSHYQLKV